MDRDYIKRQIELLAAELDTMIHVVEQSEKRENLIEGIDLVNQGLMESLNINLEEINSIPIEHFMATITVDEQLNNHNLDLLADLFFKTSHLFKLLGEKESTKRLFQRTLQIYLYLAKVEVEFPFERHLRIKELREILLQ